MFIPLLIGTTLLAADPNTSINMPAVNMPTNTMPRQDVQPPQRTAPTTQPEPVHHKTSVIPQSQSSSDVMKTPSLKLSDEKDGGSIQGQARPMQGPKNYNHPGVIAREGLVTEDEASTGDWAGGDHLINLPRHIPVQLDLSLPKESTLNISENSLEHLVEDVFKKYDLNPDDYTDSSLTPLPYFNMIVTVYQVPKGYVYSVEGRLFESVKLDRVAFDEGVGIQAITWEMSSLNGVPENKLINELNQSVSGIATTFAQRYNYFKKIEESQDKK